MVRQLHLPLRHKGLQLDPGNQVDLMVERLVIVELKAVKKLDPIHEAQLLSYLRLSSCHVVRNGMKRMVHQLPER